MRITGGCWRGRPLAAPRHGVRPTQDRVREAIFSTLGARVVGARVLDLFAGSGALGFEALSRGAAAVCWVEKDRRSLRTLRANLTALAPGADRTRVAPGDVWTFLRHGTEMVFDLVLADPPYARRPTSETDTLLPALAQSRIVGDEAWLVLEQSGHSAAPGAPGWRLERERRYGATVVLYYRKEVHA